MGKHPHTSDPRTMRRVTADHPCPVCRKPDWCLVAPDGSAAICGRITSPKRCGDAGYLHRLTVGVAPPPPRRARSRRPIDWSTLAAGFAAAFTPDRQSELADRLGIPADALAPLPLVGWSPADPGGACWTFPEVDPAAAVVGILRRFTAPPPGGAGKKAIAGGARGLHLPAGWRDRPGPVFLVEGPTDAVALTAAGLAAVGRPSNAGGVAMLADLLRDVPADRPVIVVGKGDRKPDELHR